MIMNRYHIRRMDHSSRGYIRFYGAREGSKQGGEMRIKYDRERPCQYFFPILPAVDSF